MLLVLGGAAGCEKSVSEERNEAINAQREADETAREARVERQGEVQEANREAAKEVTAARKEAREESLKAVEDEIEKTAGAQKEAREETVEAIQASKEGRMELRKSVEQRLNKIDEHARELQTKLDDASSKGTSTAVPLEARQKLTEVQRESKSLRSEIQSETATTPPMPEYKTNLERRMDALEASLDRLDDKL
jgi:arginyl-tRNA synthetase